jgi:uncharacterized membrane protein
MSITHKKFIAVIFLIWVALFTYRGILFAPDSVGQYPWGSDTLGHILKAEYLKIQIDEGNIYPNLFTDWYLGQQMLRYYPPLPYYLLVVLINITGNSLVAANWFIALCALIGGLMCLPFRRWVGWLSATFGGVFYIVLSDNIRVAMSEGNLPRVFANALLPLTIFFLFRVMEENGKRWHLAALVFCFSVLSLSHAMMAAIFAACCILLAVLFRVLRAASSRKTILAIASTGLGLMISGWWLLPSLEGGITELDPAAITEAQAVFPFSTYLNPTLRANNPEIVYPGAALILLAVGLFIIRRNRDGRVAAVTITGLLGLFISTPVFNQLFNALPFHNLFWPLRFMGFASFALLLVIMWHLGEWRKKSIIGTIIILSLLSIDGSLSLPLIHLNLAPNEIITLSELLQTTPGWREATLDYGQLGSAPSYFFSAIGNREQVYGWAYQGARTSSTVAAINEALDREYYSYVLDRLCLLGVDDVIVLNAALPDSDFEATLLAAGFDLGFQGSTITQYHRDGAPRAFRENWRVLGIGDGAQNLAYIFPQLIVGTKTTLDTYAFDELKDYDSIFLSGFEWEDQQNAENLITQVAQAGIRVIVDLSGMPEDMLARAPNFLGVWGETVTLNPEAIQVEGVGSSLQLKAFSEKFPYWKAYIPQGLDIETLYFDYLGIDSAILGYNEQGEGRVWFLGLNLVYHAMLTNDQVAIGLLSDLLQLPIGQPNDYQAVLVENYLPSQAGYSFSYELDTSETLLFPVAFHEGSAVLVDNKPVQFSSFENLIAFDAPAGEHSVNIEVKQTPIYTWGLVISGLSSVVFFLIVSTRTKDQE